MSYDSKYSGAVAEQMLDDYVAGNLGGGGGITSETDPVFLASPAAKITEQQISDWESKPDSSEIPTKTSQLTNDSGFITAADIPPSGGLPTEVIEVSSEITLQEGKMLEISMATPVTESLSLRHPTIEDLTRGLLFGIRFYCGESVPQLTFAGGLGLSGIWANGEPPQLEPNSMIEILGCATAGPYRLFLLTWAIYK